MQQDRQRHYPEQKREVPLLLSPEDSPPVAWPMFHNQQSHLGFNPLEIHNEQVVGSSPAVVNGTVYIGSADQFGFPRGRLYVYKLAF